MEARMTKSQRIAHKAGNQKRKRAILAYKDPLTGKRNRGQWLGGVIQDTCNRFNRRAA